MTSPIERVTTRCKALVRSGLHRRGLELLPTETPKFRLVNATASRPDRSSVEPRLEELRRRYAGFECPASAHTYWTSERIGRYVDLDEFRGHTMFVWQYWDRPLLTELRFLIYLMYLETMDHAGLLETVIEDGAFGAPTYEFPGRRAVSRDSLDSVNEMLFLDRELGLLTRQNLRVLDIGAGYGRLAHRMTQVVPGLTDYVCVDAIPESTFLCETYLRHRGLTPPCRVVELPDAQDVIPATSFDLAVNIHSFSEMSAASAGYWLDLVARSEVPSLLIVPNHPTKLLSHEADGSTRDLMPLILDLGYELDVREPIIKDEGVRAMFDVADHFHLFRRS